MKICSYMPIGKNKYKGVSELVDYLKSVFQQYNSDSKTGKYYIDQKENIYFARKGQVKKIAEEQNIDYLLVGKFDHNLYLYGRLENQAAGKYLLTSDGPSLASTYLAESKDEEK